MTTTEIRDPLGDVRIDMRTGDLQYSHAEYGVYAHDRPACGESDENGRTCTRPEGHDFQHINADSSRVRAIWPNIGPDPAVKVTVGQALSDITDYANADKGVLVDPARWCSAPHRGYVCTRPANHPDEHVACTPEQVVAIWGNTSTDPFANVDGGYTHDRANYQDPIYGLSAETPCGFRVPTSEAVCRRPPGHPGKHIGSTQTGRIRWTKKVKSVDLVLDGLHIQDPLDGTPPDTADPVSGTLATGSVLRLRDRATLMFLMSQNGDSAEVLDMSRWQVRRLPLRMLMATEQPITPEDLREVMRWYSGHRDQVRKVAVREYRNDRWCMGGLNDNLRSLGFEDYVPTLRGTITVQLPFEHSDSSVDQSRVEAELMAALSNPEVAAAMRVALPLIEGIELESENLRVSATNFMRK